MTDAESIRQHRARSGHDEGGCLTVAGLVLVLLGGAGVAVLVGFVQASSDTGVAVIGLGRWQLATGSVRTTIVVSAVLSAVAAALILGGVASVVRARRKRREEHVLMQDADVARLATVRRLLEERVELLRADVRELDERKRRLQAPTLAGDGEVASDPVVVIPDAPPPRADPAGGLSNATA